MKKNTAKFLSVMLCAFMLAAMLPAFSFASETVEIDSYDDLIAFAQDVNSGRSNAATVTLTADIDASAEPDIIPVGTEASPFTGSFDGAGHTVYAYAETESYAGLFGYTDGAEIKDLTVKGGFYADGDYAGSVVAYAKNTTVTGCTVSSSAEAGNYAGGIVGFAEGCEISGCTESAVNTVNCYSDYCGGVAGYAFKTSVADTETASLVTGKNYTGGVAGAVDGGEITRCVNTGTVEGRNRAAGIAALSKESTIAVCANKGAVSVSGDTVAGIAAAVSGGKIENCYNAGNVSADSGSKFAGIFATLVSGTVSCCYNAGQVSGALKTYAGIGSSVSGKVEYCYCIDTAQKTFISGSDPDIVSCKILSSSDMKAKESFAGFDFDETWCFLKLHGYDYPALGALNNHKLSFVSAVKAGCVTEGFDEYLCTVCGETVIKNTVSANGHKYKTLEYSAATCTENGYGEFACENCDATLSEVYEALGHLDADKDGKCDFCGEKVKADEEKEELNFFELIIDFFRRIINFIKGLFK